MVVVNVEAGHPLGCMLGNHEPENLLEQWLRFMP
jgi:hypothetical protein